MTSAVLPDQPALSALLTRADPKAREPVSLAGEAAAQALALARRLNQPLEAARAGAWLCSHLQRQGRYAEVVELAQPLLADLAQPPLAQALMTERLELIRIFVLTSCETGHFDQALDRARELVDLSAALDDPEQLLKATFGLGVCFERMGDSWQAQRVISDSLREHGANAPKAPKMLMFNTLCAIAIGQFHRMHGAVPQQQLEAVLNRAFEAGTQAWQCMPAPPDLVYQAVISGNLGEVLTYQGQMEVAKARLQEAMNAARDLGLSTFLDRVRTTHAVWLLRSGQAQQALAEVSQLIEQMGDQAPPQTAIRAHHAAYQACKELGLFQQALQHFEVLERLERQRSLQQLKAQSELFVTRSETQQAQWQAQQARKEANRQRALAAELAESAERDPLTGLGNRRHFERRCMELLSALESEAAPLAVVMLDVDHFKRINDTHGHGVGDSVLIALADLLRKSTRPGDVLVRYGGEEFLILLPRLGPTNARAVCERLREHVAAHEGCCSEVRDLRFTVSLGVATAAAPPFDIGRLLEAADQALYRAKSEGRNRLCLAPSVAVAQARL